MKVAGVFVKTLIKHLENTKHFGNGMEWNGLDWNGME